MWEKIKEFFKSKTTKIVSWIVFAVSVIFLLLGGIVAGDINEAVEMIDKIVGLVAVIIAFITERCKK